MKSESATVKCGFRIVNCAPRIQKDHCLKMMHREFGRIISFVVEVSNADRCMRSDQLSFVRRTLQQQVVSIVSVHFACKLGWPWFGSDSHDWVAITSTVICEPRTGKCDYVTCEFWTTKSSLWTLHWEHWIMNYDLMVGMLNCLLKLAWLLLGGSFQLVWKRLESTANSPMWFTNCRLWTRHCELCVRNMD